MQSKKAEIMASSGWRQDKLQNSLPEVFSSVSVPMQGSSFKKFLAFLGPGLLVAVGYMDPGNWATDIAGGAQFGYMLLSVIFISNIFAMIMQHLSLKLGIVAERDLAQACRDHYPPYVSYFLWILCELAIIATDLAELLGSAIALNLLFGIPMIVGVILTALDVMVILMLQQRGFRYIEALVSGLILLIFGIFVYEIIRSNPDFVAVSRGLIPDKAILMNPSALLLAIGILGATVMPHNLYLHSALVQTRAYPRDIEGKKMAIKFATWDVSLALGFAFFVNAAILVVSASTFHFRDMHYVADIFEAHRLLDPILGTSLASFLFAISLLASGQNSTFTSTLAGQIVMEGFLDWKLKPWLRRLITRSLAIIPAVVILSIKGSEYTSNLLVWSQVVLSLQLSFAVIPLVKFTSNRLKMGQFVNKPWLIAVSYGITACIVGLNLFLVYDFVFN
ncbi:MAG: Nramp family divalent metal transporter [Chitinophagales bacterium]|nr:Nramp family divalent metal transporter [Chitinophagales bacterium]